MRKLLVAASLLAGCASVYDQEQLPEVTTLVVAPPRMGEGIAPDQRAALVEYGAIFADQLARLRHYRVVRPGQAQAIMDQAGMKLEEASKARQLARLCKAEGVFVIEITDFDPYPPKRLALALQFYGVGNDGGRWNDPVLLEQMGRPFGFRLDDPRGRPSISIERVYDADVVATRAAAADFADDHDGQRPLAQMGNNAYLQVTPMFLRFTAHTVIREVFDRVLSESMTPPAAAATGAAQGAGRS